MNLSAQNSGRKFIGDFDLNSFTLKVVQANGEASTCFRHQPTDDDKTFFYNSPQCVRECKKIIYHLPLDKNDEELSSLDLNKIGAPSGPLDKSFVVLDVFNISKHKRFLCFPAQYELSEQQKIALEKQKKEAEELMWKQQVHKLYNVVESTAPLAESTIQLMLDRMSFSKGYIPDSHCLHGHPNRSVSMGDEQALVKVVQECLKGKKASFQREFSYKRQPEDSEEEIDTQLKKVDEMMKKPGSLLLFSVNNDENYGIYAIYHPKNEEDAFMAYIDGTLMFEADADRVWCPGSTGCIRKFGKIAGKPFRASVCEFGTHDEDTVDDAKLLHDVKLSGSRCFLNPGGSFACVSTQMAAEVDLQCAEVYRVSPWKPGSLDKHAARLADFKRVMLSDLLLTPKWHLAQKKANKEKGPKVGIIGEPGTGKSALLATWILALHNRDLDKLPKSNSGKAHVTRVIKVYRLAFKSFSMETVDTVGYTMSDKYGNGEVLQLCEGKLDGVNIVDTNPHERTLSENSPLDVVVFAFSPKSILSFMENREKPSTVKSILDMRLRQIRDLGYEPMVVLTKVDSENRELWSSLQALDHVLEKPQSDLHKVTQFLIDQYGFKVEDLLYQKNYAEFDREHLSDPFIDVKALENLKRVYQRGQKKILSTLGLTSKDVLSDFNQCME